jgi:hypothetical protein
MKSALTLISIFTIVVATTLLAHAYPPGMVSYWPFDEGTAIDTVGTNHGIITGAPVVVMGKVGNALKFDGIDDGIIVPNSPSLNPSQITLEAWVYYLSLKTDWFPRRNMIFDKRYEALGSYVISYSGYGTGGWDNNLSIDGTWVSSSGNAPKSEMINKWHHFAITFDGSYIKTYMDGNLLETVTRSGSITPTK